MSNAQALYADTGVDVRDTHKTVGIVAFKREWLGGGLNNGAEYTDIIHHDKEPILGRYNRIMDIAQEAANYTGEVVHYAMRSGGGGSSGAKKPETKEVDEIPDEDLEAAAEIYDRAIEEQVAADARREGMENR